MKLQVDNLGKVAITVEQGYWDYTKDYDKLTIVERQGEFATYISRKPVPAGKMLSNREYWIPFSSLKESIVLDYNAFINKYDNQLKQAQQEIADLINDVDRLKALKSDIVSAIAMARQASNDANKATAAANESIKIVKSYIDALGFSSIGEGLSIIDKTLNVNTISGSELDEILI